MSVDIMSYNNQKMDLDDELAMLQRQLMAVQEEKTNPLSERTVAQIMIKLYHEGFAFIPTTDGNQYVTPHKLDEEVASLVRERGKISLNIIPQLLNIGPDVIEARLNQIMHRWAVTRQGGNLFSQKYFETVITGLAQRLEEEGRIELESIAVEHEFKMEFTERLVIQNLGRLKAELDGKQLITQEYTLLERSKILGFLSAIRKPLQIDVLYKAVGIQARSAEKLVIQLIQEGKVKGKFANSFFIPSSFTSNQKRITQQFLTNNGYLDTQMLQKKFMINKPGEWIEKNLNSDFIQVQSYYFQKDRLDSIKSQLNSLLDSEGFIEVSQVLPIELEQNYLQQFLEERCGLKDYFLCDGYCYSNNWLQKLAEQFKFKIIHSIFFKKQEPKGKDPKKKAKKEKTELITEDDLKDMLFQGGYADYTMAQTLAPELLQLMLRRLEELRKKTEKELGHSKGFISSTFLKYRNCKTILRTEQSLNLSTNIIQKQINKGNNWVDPDFGPSQTDQNGSYSIIYYDNVLPKGWPTLDSLKWQEVHPGQLLKPEDNERVYPMKRCLLTPLLKLIQVHNQQNNFKLAQPSKQQLKQDSVSPFLFEFFINEKDKRHVLVDNKLPFVEGSPFGSLSPFSLLQKAYAKFRYCYKGLLSVGLHQMLLEMTGRICIRYCADTESERSKIFPEVHEHVVNQDFILVLAEGEAEKRLRSGEEELELVSLQPYLLLGKPEQLTLYPSGQVLPLKQVLDLFRNIFVIQPK